MNCFRSRTVHQIRSRYRSIPPGPPGECWRSWRFYPSIDICCAVCRVSSTAVESGPPRCRLGPGDNISGGDCTQVLVGGFAMRCCSAFAIWQVLTRCAARDSSELIQPVLEPTPLFSYASACILLYRLDEVCTRMAQGSGEDYLRMLGMKLRIDERQDTQQRLQIVRLALAKYFARCAMIGTGGTQIIDRRVGPTV